MLTSKPNILHSTLPNNCFIHSNFFILLLFRVAAGLFAVLSVHAIYTKYGFPQLTTAYGQKVIPDPLCMQVFLGVFLLATKPYMFAIAPVVCHELTSFTPQILQVSMLLWMFCLWLVIAGCVILCQLICYFSQFFIIYHHIFLC